MILVTFIVFRIIYRKLIYSILDTLEYIQKWAYSYPRLADMDTKFDSDTSNSRTTDSFGLGQTLYLRVRRSLVCLGCARIHALLLVRSSDSKSSKQKVWNSISEIYFLLMSSKLSLSTLGKTKTFLHSEVLTRSHSASWSGDTHAPFEQVKVRLYSSGQQPIKFKFFL